MILKVFLVFVLLIAFVPPFRKFMFWLLVGRTLVNEQKKAQKATQRREGEVRVEKRQPPQTDIRGGDYVDYEELKD